MYIRLKHIFCCLLCCTAVFFLSCISTPDSPSPDRETVFQAESAEQPKATGGKKTQTSEAKKLTVVYDDSVKAEEKPLDLLAEYKTLLENIHLKIERIPPETVNGRSFASEFSVSVTDTQGNPLSGITLTVKYPSGRLNGKLLFAAEDIQSDENGIARFSGHVPEFSCNTDILFYPAADMQDVQVLQYAEEQALRVPYKVHTDKTNKALSISMLDYNQSGKAITTNSLSSSALLKALYKKGFRSAGNADFIGEINSGDMQLLYKNASALFRGKINYLIFGTVKYEKPVTKGEDGLYETVLTANVFIMDMSDSTVISRTTQSFAAKDTNEWQLLDTIRNKLLAPALAEFIYYNL